MDQAVTYNADLGPWVLSINCLRGMMFINQNNYLCNQTCSIPGTIIQATLPKDLNMVLTMGSAKQPADVFLPLFWPIGTERRGCREPLPQAPGASTCSKARVNDFITILSLESSHTHSQPNFQHQPTLRFRELGIRPGDTTTKNTRVARCSKAVSIEELFHSHLLV